MASILYDQWRPGMAEDAGAKSVQAIRLQPLSGQDSKSDTRWCVDGSYIRGNLFQLGYNFNKGVTNALRIGSLRTYVSVENAFVITSKLFQGYDPEAQSDNRGNPFEQNAAFFSYPRPIVVTLGANVTF